MLCKICLILLHPVDHLRVVLSLRAISTKQFNKKKRKVPISVYQKFLAIKHSFISYKKANNVWKVLAIYGPLYCNDPIGSSKTSLLNALSNRNKFCMTFILEKFSETGILCFFFTLSNLEIVSFFMKQLQ